MYCRQTESWEWRATLLFRLKVSLQIGAAFMIGVLLLLAVASLAKVKLGVMDEDLIPSN